MTRSTLPAGMLVLALTLGACAQPASTPEPAASAPVAGFVTDVDAFERFIATKPTPEQFRRTYPDVKLVLPGEIATKEFRMNNSRYFADLDGEGRISGGRFM